MHALGTFRLKDGESFPRGAGVRASAHRRRARNAIGSEYTCPLLYALFPFPAKGVWITAAKNAEARTGKRQNKRKSFLIIPFFKEMRQSHGARAAEPRKRRKERAANAAKRRRSGRRKTNRKTGKKGRRKPADKAESGPKYHPLRRRYTLQRLFPSFKRTF